MFFLNLSAGEFLTLLGALGGLISALYLLDRAKRKKAVSTLRFWVPAAAAEQQENRKRVREPWSLILQLVSLGLLLLAIAQVQWGNRERRGRDHVLLLDTSAWTAERNGTQTLLDTGKQATRQYLSLLPTRDRVMLVSAGSLATPLTPFTADRSQLNAALASVRSGYAVLNVDLVLSFAQQAQSWSGGPAGEIVYIGPKLVNENPTIAKTSGLRIVPTVADREHCGIRQLSVRQLEDQADSWQAFVRLKNYGAKARAVRLNLNFSGTAFTPRLLSLAPGEERTAEYNFTTRTAGQLVAAIYPPDNLGSDARVNVHLPLTRSLKVGVYTARPQALAPLLRADRALAVTFYSPSEYSSRTGSDVIVFDGMASPEPPPVPSLWIDPPPDRSPVPVQERASNVVVDDWRPQSALGSDLHFKELRVSSAETFKPQPADLPLALAAQGPVVVVRPRSQSHPMLAVVGFDPASGPLRFELATPLLFANLLQWLAPDAFRTLAISAERVGISNVALDAAEASDKLRVTNADGINVPFTVRDRSLQVFVDRPSTLHVLSPEHERTLSLTLPDIAEGEWKLPANVAEGLPPAGEFHRNAVDLWKALALLGGLGLLLEWLLFGRKRIVYKLRSGKRTPSSRSAARERELVAK